MCGAKKYNNHVVEKKFDLRLHSVSYGQKNGANKYFCSKEIKSMSPQIKRVCEHQRTRQVLLGTRGGQIIELIPLINKKPKVVDKYHYR